jgi:hypothetical protein
MNKLSFGLETPEHFFELLEYNYEQYRLDVTSKYAALDCAIIAWHMIDWMYWKENPNNNPKDKTALSTFRKQIIDDCKSLKYMCDIADGTKHFNLVSTRPTQTGALIGDFGSDYGRDFNQDCLWIIGAETEEKIYFEDAIEKVVKFWRNYIYK